MSAYSVWELPTSLDIGGVGFSIRTDFRVILDILNYFSDPEYEPDEQTAICIRILYEDWEKIPPELYEEATEKARWFIDAGMTNDGKPKPRTMDWEQDAPLIISAVNHVTGHEIRAVPYMHWWTFVGAYMEIGTSLYSTVVSIRQKKLKHKKLEKQEQEFYNANKDLVDLKRRYTEEEKAEQERLKEMLGG